MATIDAQERILGEYQQRRETFADFTSELVRLLGRLLQPSGGIIHSVSGRVKEHDSLRRKIERPDKGYGSVGDVTDICGVRIIVYFSDNVDQVAEVVRREFVVDSDKSVDKRGLLDPDRFGYLSLHYVVGLTNTRLQLTEYGRFRGYQAEIQIRSILQHSWAEIEHDLDYKSPLAVPREIRRDFSRVAGLLELADGEFVRIRKALEVYKETVGIRIASSPEGVYVDKLSLVQYAKGSELVQAIDKDMAGASHVGVSRLGFSWIEDYVEHLHYFGVNTIADLDASLVENRSFLADYASERLAKQNYVNLLPGVSISYLPYALAGKSLRKEDVTAYFEAFKLYSDYTNREAAMEEVAVLVIRLMTKYTKGCGATANPTVRADG